MACSSPNEVHVKLYKKKAMHNIFLLLHVKDNNQPWHKIREILDKNTANVVCKDLERHHEIAIPVTCFRVSTTS